jgi:type II secretory ATPase GspE/PulE/Tfp pilus assembly ATPase PilB-like protein/TolB-like protein/Tfp pilus assembly protein PilF
MEMIHEHWLIRAARQARLAGADAIQVHFKTPVKEAWTTVADTCKLTDYELASKVAPQVGMNPAEFDSVEDSVTTLLPEAVVRQLRVFPLRTQRNHLIVATSDPANLEAEQAIAFCAGRRVVFELAAPSQVEAEIEALYSPERVAEHLLTVERSELADAIRLVQTTEGGSSSAPEVEAAPIVRLTNLILHEAIAAGASDVHIEPEMRGGLVRFRIDGVMQNYMPLPRQVLDPLVLRLKVMGNMDVSDRLRPQSGRAQIEARGMPCDLRISTVPTRQSEKAVVRLLRPGKSQLLAELALPDSELKRLRQLFAYKDGLVVVTGPTGSGKTTTLYAALRELATGTINIMTVEDPVEYAFSGVTQIQVAPRQGLTFASVLRTILRQDPDVILVGEIRDLETAEIALQASMTGHLVLTTLHTMDAAGVIPRLAGLGLNKANIASSLRGVVAQRLVRRICPQCRTAGCSACRGTGYRGRLPIVELFLNTPAVEQAIADGASLQVLNRIARESGMVPMQTVAMDRVKAGETTPEEVERVLGTPQEEEEKKKTAPLRTPHVLMVAGDATIRRAARSLLERDGCRVSEAADGLAALQRVSEPNDYVLAVVDLDMPGMDGRQLLSRLKSSSTTLALPVLMLMPPDDGDLESGLMEQGADDCIRKPIDAASFSQQLKGCLRRIGVSGPAHTRTDLNRLLEASWPSVAVLPFTDMSPGRDQGYLCEGLAEELIGALSKLDGLRVASRTSSFRARAADMDIRGIGKQLGVEAVLEGTVQKAGDRLRISTHLINMEDGYDLWSERYDRGLEDVFDLQDEISQSIVAKLSVVLLGQAAKPIVERATKNTEAYDLYLKGRYHWNKRTEEGLKRSVELFKEAIRHDPNYALAYAGLADAYVTLGIYGAVAPSDAMPEASRAAERALGVDAKSAEAVSAQGCVRALYLWDWDAEADFKRAIELDPHNAKTHHWYASNYLLPLARFADARSELEIAFRLDPLSPAIHATSGVLLYYECRFDDAIKQLSKTRELDPEFGFAPFFIGQACTQLARHDDAIAALRLAENLTARSPEVLAALAYAQVMAGQSNNARNTMNELIRLSGERYVSPVLLSQVALGMGEKDRALAYLKQAYEIRATDLVWIGVRPVFDSIRSEAAFVELSSQLFPQM